MLRQLPMGDYSERNLVGSRNGHPTNAYALPRADLPSLLSEEGISKLTSECI